MGCWAMLANGADVMVGRLHIKSKRTNIKRLNTSFSLFRKGDKGKEGKEEKEEKKIAAGSNFSVREAAIRKLKTTP